MTRSARWIGIAVTTLWLLLARDAAAQPADSLYKCHKPPAGTKLNVSFKTNTSIVDLAVWVTGFTCKNVIFDADVAKHATKVTVISSNPMTVAQATQLFVDSIEATGLVVVDKPDTIIIKLGPKMPRNCPDIAQAPPPPAFAPSPTPPPPPDPKREAFNELMDRSIRMVDETTYEIKRVAVDAMLAEHTYVTTAARMVPAMKNGVKDGIKVYAVRPTSTFAKLGITNGDTLKTLGGLDLAASTRKTSCSRRSARRSGSSSRSRGEART